MKKEELRIGNWYQSVKWNVPVKCDLTDLYNLSANANGADDDPPIDEMFEPIPLTEEWVRKFGFRKTSNRSDNWHNDGTFLYVRYIRKVFYIYTSGSNGPCQLTTVKYVHQLQNLNFALTGKELMV